ncbi:amidohydrolase [Rhodococcus sp. NCIMB 12038]|uniref:amidohydrolase family protein n=1 Tax=Rhodococcus sp. NCIMB 12038 TaxID=933800 RepID=UPI000B3CA7CE|nr:amidohydrolase family protein [Rhodococcus sp. NCIMB 12038]OUS96395.1 amidohydrolase [Rhodococcus sp. NCIMB 12038]
MLCEVDIVDAHHHFIDLPDLAYPWIDSRPLALTALLPNYYDAARRYVPHDYRAQVDGIPVTASVACEFGAADGVAEAIWVQQCADRVGVPNAFIAAVQLDSPDLASVLARYRDLPVVQAVRQPLYWAADPVKRLGARGDYLSDPEWLRGFEKVAEAGLVWELLVYDEQLPDAHELIAAFPDTTFVLEAVGWPVDLTAEGYSRWKERLGAVSQFPNVVLKFQGIALIFGTSLDAIGRWVRTAVGIFGAGRCMFASHYPIDHLLWDSETMVSTMQAALGDLPSAEQALFFGETARRVYRLPAAGS